jgi:hypothetical protein
MSRWAGFMSMLVIGGSLLVTMGGGGAEEGERRWADLQDL